MTLKKGISFSIGSRVSALLLFLFVTPVCLAANRQPVNVTPEMIEQAASLKQREEAVTAREDEVARRGNELAVLEKEVDAKVAALGELQKDLQEKIDYINGLNVRDREFKNLIKVYTEMSASKMAPLLNTMNDGEVTKILRGLKADQVAKIMPKLDPDKAVRVSRLLGLLE